jgi:hypothetical protein
VNKLNIRSKPPTARGSGEQGTLSESSVLQCEPDDRDLEPACINDIPPLVPKGLYEVVFVRAEEKILWGRKKVFLHFRIMQAGDYLGQVLFMAVTFPSNGRFAVSSKYLQQWSLAAGKRPARRDRLSTKVFRNKSFLAQVRTVEKDSAGEERSLLAQYSVIDKLIQVQTGANA